VASPVFAEALWGAVAGGGELDRETVTAAERLAGLELTDAERDLMLEGLDELRGDYAALREVELVNAVPPAFYFDPEAAAGVAPRGLTPEPAAGSTSRSAA